MEQVNLIWRHIVGPDYTLLMVVLLDYGSHQPIQANAVRTHKNGLRFAVFIEESSASGV